MFRVYYKTHLHFLLCFRKMTRPITTGAELQGKTSAMVVCWLLGSLFVWNSMLTAEDYYLSLFPRYHPTRVFTVVYVLFTLGTSSILAYNETTVDLATSGDGGLATYVGLCCIVVLSGLGDGCVEGGMLGDLSLMCPEFIQSFLAVGSASGVLTSVLRLKAVFENLKNGLRKGAMSVFKIFRYALVLLAMFNVLDLVGRYIPMVESLKLKSRRGLMIATVSLFALIPVFYFTSKYGDQGWMLLLTSILGLSHGYLNVCYFTVAPQGYK
ncbi:hypothetical protein C5167_050808, partial [Papaver somniferum]